MDGVDFLLVVIGSNFSEYDLQLSLVNRPGIICVSSVEINGTSIVWLGVLACIQEHAELVFVEMSLLVSIYQLQNASNCLHVMVNAQFLQRFRKFLYCDLTSLFGVKGSEYLLILI